MKRLKNYLYLGIVYLLVGIAFVFIELKFGTKSDNMLYLLAFAGFFYGGFSLFKYFYWSRPENKDRYYEKIEERNVEIDDERKTILRDKSGRYAYNIGLTVLSITIVLLTIINSVGNIENFNFIIIYIAGYMMFQYVIGVLIFNHLSKKN